MASAQAGTCPSSLQVIIMSTTPLLPVTQAEPFKREERYIVVKLSRLPFREKMEPRLRSEITRYAGEDALVECVVVESDWPEYETVWQMIEARCTGHRIEAEAR